MSEGIFIKVLPQLELAALASVITQMKNILSKAGPEMSASMAASKREIVALQDQVIASANRAAQAQIRANKLAGDSAVQEAKRGATADAARQKAVEDRTAAELTAINAVDNAHAKRAQSAKEAEQADAKAAQTSKDLVAAQAAMGSQAAMTGGAFGAMGGAAAAAFGVLSGVSLDAATKFETGMARIQVAGQVPVDQMKAMQDGLLQLSASMGEPLAKLSEASLMLAKAGPQYKEAANNMLILKSAIELSKTEGADLTTTVQQMTTIMTDFSMSTDQAANVAAKLQVAASNAKRPLEEFLGALHNVEPTAALMLNKGTGPDELLGAMGQMAQFGASMDDVTNNMNNFLQHLGNPSGPQRQALGLLNIDSNKLAEDLKKPNGLITVLGELHDAMAKLPHTGSGEDVTYQLGTAFKNPQTTKLMNDDLSQLPPMQRALAERIMSSEQSGGVISADDARESRRIQGQGGIFADWMKKWKQTTGVNGLAAAGIDPNNLPLEMLYGMLGGSYASNRSMFGLMGNPTDPNDPHWKNSQQNMGVTVPNAKPDANGDLGGWDVFKGTNKQKIDELKGAMEKLAVSIGTTLLPAAKHVVDALNLFFDALTKFKPVVTIVTDALAVMTLRWVALKAAMAFGNTFTALSTGFKTVATDAEAASLAAGGIGGATKTAATEADIAATATAGSLGKVGKEAETTVGKIGKIGDKLKFLGSMVWPVAIGLTIYDIASSLADATDATPDLHQKLVHDQGGRGRFSSPGHHAKGGINYPSDVDPSVDHRGVRGGDADGTSSLTPPADSSSPLTPGASSDPGAPGGPGSDSPAGSPSDPIFVNTLPKVDPSGLSGVGASGDPLSTGLNGDTGGLGAIQNPLEQLKGGGFGLSNIAKIMTTFLMEMALGNPLGHLLTGTSMFGGDQQSGDANATSQIGDLEKMTAGQRKAMENDIAMKNAMIRYQTARNNAAKVFSKYGRNSTQGQAALGSLLEAQDSIDQLQLTQQDASESGQTSFLNAYKKLQSDQLHAAGDTQVAADQAQVDKYKKVFPDDATMQQFLMQNGLLGTSSGAPGAGADAGGPKKKEWFDYSHHGGDGPGGTGGGAGGGNGVSAGGVNLSSIPAAAQKYANDCIDASARIILSHAGTNMSEDQLKNVITPGGSINSLAAGLNQLDPQGGFEALQGSGGSQQAMFNAIKASIDKGVGSILNVAPGSSLGGHTFAPGHYIAATGYNPDGTINLKDTAGGTQYSVSQADAFQATSGRGIVAGTGSGPGARGGGGGGPGLGGLFGLGASGPKVPAPAAGSPMIGAGAAGPQGLPKPAAGSSMFGSAAATAASSPTPSNQAAYSNPGTGGGGVGLGQTGLSSAALGALNSTVALAVDGVAPGAGAAAQLGMQIGEQELSNVANYVGKIAGVGVDGVFETLGVSDPDGGQTGPKGGQNWLTKIFGGLAGGHPITPNGAGATQPPVKPDDNTPGQGTGPAPGPGDGSGNNVTFNNTFHGASDPQANVTKMNQMMLTAPTAPS